MFCRFARNEGGGNMAEIIYSKIDGIYGGSPVSLYRITDHYFLGR